MWETVLGSYADSGLGTSREPPIAGRPKGRRHREYGAFLCSEYAGHITGQPIGADGGAPMN